MYTKTHSLDSILRKDMCPRSWRWCQVTFFNYHMATSKIVPAAEIHPTYDRPFLWWPTSNDWRGVNYAQARTALKGHACCRAPRGVRGGCHQPALQLIFSLSQFLFLSLPSQAVVISASLLNILYTKFSLRRCFLRSQPATVCFIQRKNIYTINNKTWSFYNFASVYSSHPCCIYSFGITTRGEVSCVKSSLLLRILCTWLPVSS